MGITSLWPREGKTDLCSVWICSIRLNCMDPWAVCGMCLQLSNCFFIWKIGCPDSPVQVLSCWVPHAMLSQPPSRSPRYFCSAAIWSGDRAVGEPDARLSAWLISVLGKWRGFPWPFRVSADSPPRACWQGEPQSLHMNPYLDLPSLLSAHQTLGRGHLRAPELLGGAAFATVG